MEGCKSEKNFLSYPKALLAILPKSIKSYAHNCLHNFSFIFKFLKLVKNEVLISRIPKMPLTCYSLFCNGLCTLGCLFYADRKLHVSTKSFAKIFGKSKNTFLKTVTKIVETIEIDRFSHKNDKILFFFSKNQATSKA